METPSEPSSFIAPSPGTEIAERFSWGAFLIPEFWYLIHRLWWRAAYFWLISIGAMWWFLLMDWSIGDEPYAPTVVWYLLYYGSSYACARNARSRAREASCLYDDDVLLVRSERLWLIAGLVWLGWDAVRLLR
ncbi:MAG: hypothetical protein Q7W44_05125 [Coriobacteriia bacterium]|nr:hypothetical protein [Coriobacteriia bacterium]